MTLLIFDCDGTLTDTEQLHSEVDCAFIDAAYGVTWDVQEMNRRFAGGTSAAVELALSEAIGRPLPGDHRDRLFAYKSAEFRKKLAPCAYVHEALAALRDYRMAVASNALMRMLTVNLEAAGLYDLFAPHIYSSSMVERPKPAPDLFLHAARQSGVGAEDCLVIEDSEPGVAAARAAGMRVIGYAGGQHCYPGYAGEKLRHADVVIDDMRKLPEVVRALEGGAKRVSQVWRSEK
ncbi:MAG: HAD family phosphatase [Bdellovibrionales bacterium]